MSTLISYFSEDTDFELNSEKRTTDWLSKLVKTHQKILGDITYIFCSDAYLLSINKEYLQHDTFTDIVTFNYNHSAIISGDIFISIDRVRENAEKFAVSFETELYRVVIHGILHLCGFDHEISEDEEKIMEDFEVSLVKRISDLKNN